MRALSRLKSPLLLIAVVAVLISSGTAAAQTTTQSSDARFFSQTSYRIDNDAFWNFFQQRGNVRTFGYPVSRTFKLDGFQVQIFQRRLRQSATPTTTPTFRSSFKTTRQTRLTAIPSISPTPSLRPSPPRMRPTHQRRCSQASIFRSGVRPPVNRPTTPPITSSSISAGSAAS
jgi:hypothetical protein